MQLKVMECYDSLINDYELIINIRSLYGVGVNMLDCDIIVSKFELQSPLSPPAMGR